MTSVRDTPPKVQGLIFIGAVAIILLIRGTTDLGRQDFRGALICLSLGAGLAIVFFRRRMLAFILTGLALIFVGYGVDMIFQPTVLGILLTAAAFLAACLIAVWDMRRHPGQNPNDWAAIFNNNRK